VRRLRERAPCHFKGITSRFGKMIARFRRTLSRAQHRISMIMIMDQDQQRVGRQCCIRREAFRSNLFGREILPADEKLHAAFFHLCNRFEVWIARAKPRCNRDSERSHNQQDDRNGTQGNCKISAIHLLRGFAELAPPNTSKPNYFRFSQRFSTSGGAEINDGED